VIAHAQFETIHPFADGNGRLGRVLIGRMLARSLAIAVPPPVSLQLARDVGGYQAGLTLYRQGSVDRWVAWFADAVSLAAARAGEVLELVDAQRRTWLGALTPVRADAATRRIVEILPSHPVLSAVDAARLVGVSERAAQGALAQLGDLGILTATKATATERGRPRQWWVAQPLLDLLGT
jgi:Fic family protein